MDIKEKDIMICGHGSGSPSTKNMNTYLGYRYGQIATNGKHKGLVKVMRLKAMTDDKRIMFHDTYKTILGRNQYNQNLREYCYTMYKGKFYSDCSSSGIKTYEKCGYKFPWILNTAGIYKSNLFEEVPVQIKDGHILNPEILKVGDALLFVGNDSSRPLQIGHVEYVYEMPNMVAVKPTKKTDGIIGLDVSENQGDIDWEKVYGAGYRYAFLRAVKRSGIDSKFERNYSLAKDVNVLVGAYIYSYAMSVREAVVDADRLLAVLKNKQMDLPIALDLEYSKQGALGRTAVTDIALTFINRIKEKSDYKVIIYSNQDWHDRLIDWARLDGIEWWAARVSKEDNGTLKIKPSGNYIIHQYSWKGKVPGIVGSVDLDMFYKTYPESKNEWYKCSNKWHYGIDGKDVVAGFKKIDGRWYAFDNNGDMVVGWYKDNNKWYYLGQDGAMLAEQWVQDKNKWYYLNGDGAMRSSDWILYKNNWYYLCSDGSMAMDCFVKDTKGRGYCYLSSSGIWDKRYILNATNKKIVI